MANRRSFLKTSLITAGFLMSNPVNGILVQSNNSWFMGKSGKLKFRFKPYDLILKHVFTIASNSRATTAIMLTELEFDGIVGYGEASMPPYLGESHETATKFLSGLDLSQFNDPFLIEDILGYIEKSAPGNYAAKASVDIALHDLVGKLMGHPWYRVLGLDPAKTPNTSYTIGIDKPEIVKLKVAEAAPYKILKVKLGRVTDREMIETIRSVTDKPICADANQGWKDKNQAVDTIHWLKEKGVIFIEQPMDKTNLEDNAWVTANSPLPVIADESLQTHNDILKLKGVFSGINIKLMKCGGLRAAKKMIDIARLLDMKVMIGCMTETSCAVSAAAHLSPMVDWADLDGNLLISNDVYEGAKIIDGKITLNQMPGIGIKVL